LLPPAVRTLSNVHLGAIPSQSSRIQGIAHQHTELDSTEGPAQKRPGPQYSYLTGIRVSVALAPKPLERSMQVHSILQGESLNQDLQTDARQHIAAIARWDNEGGACNVLSKKTDAELKKRPRSKRNDREPTDG
jgi:hypothetical protein